MYEQWHWRLAEERRRDLLAEAQQAQLLKEAGVRDGAPRGLKVLALALVSLPFALLLVRAWLKM